MDGPRPWHRWFGLTWMDFFHGTAVTVEMEKDTAVQQQMLDVLILRRGEEPIGREMPDGMEGLAGHNLITFKSHHEALDEWALKELAGHYVAYRKLVSPSPGELLPEEEFRLFAICARSPEGMAGRGQVPLLRVRDGVYDVPAYGARLIVVRELPREGRNAMLGLFGGEGLLQWGYQNYRPRSGIGSLLNEMLGRALQEGWIMADKLEEYIREANERWLREIPVEKRLEGITAQEVLKVLPPREVLQAVPPEQRLEGLSEEEIIAALPPGLREALRRAKPVE